MTNLHCYAEITCCIDCSPGLGFGRRGIGFVRPAVGGSRWRIWGWLP